MLASLALLLMAYPYQVDAGNTLTFSNHATRNQGPGLFHYGNSYFTVLVDGTANVLKVLMSIDRGKTWVVVDNANNKPIAADSEGPQRQQYATVLDPVGSANLIWVVWVSPPVGGVGPAYCASFNMATELWGQTITGGPDLIADIPDMVLGMRIPLIGPGQPVLFYNGPRDIAGPPGNQDLYDRQFYIPLPITPPAIWGLPIRVNDSEGEEVNYSFMLGAPMGTNGRLHAVVMTTGGDNTIQARTISREDLKGSWSTLATETAGTSFGGNFGTPFSSEDGSTIVVPYAQGALAFGATWNLKLQIATSAQEPTWNQETAATDIYENMATGSATGAYVSGKLFVAWQRVNGVGISPKYFYARKSGLIWGAKTVLHDTLVPSVFSEVVAAYPVSGGVGVFFDFSMAVPPYSFVPWYWELRTAGNLNSILGAMRSAKVTP